MLKFRNVSFKQTEKKSLSFLGLAQVLKVEMTQSYLLFSWGLSRLFFDQLQNYF